MRVGQNISVQLSYIAIRSLVLHLVLWMDPIIDTEISRISGVTIQDCLPMVLKLKDMSLQYYGTLRMIPPYSQAPLLRLGTR